MNNTPVNIENEPITYPPIIVLKKILIDSPLKIELSDCASLYDVSIIKNPITINAHSIYNQLSFNIL